MFGKPEIFDFSFGSTSDADLLRGFKEMVLHVHAMICASRLGFIYHGLKIFPSVVFEGVHQFSRPPIIYTVRIRFLGFLKSCMSGSGFIHDFEYRVSGNASQVIFNLFSCMSTHVDIQVLHEFTQRHRKND